MEEKKKRQNGRKKKEGACLHGVAAGGEPMAARRGDRGGDETVPCAMCWLRPGPPGCLSAAPPAGRPVADARPGTTRPPPR